jgi:hypothetical protein
MRFVINITVGDREAGMPLIEWLVYHLIDERRVGILKAIRVGRVAINRQPVYDPDHRLLAGVEVGYQEAGDDPEHAEPWTPLPGVRVAISGDQDPS